MKTKKILVKFVLLVFLVFLVLEKHFFLSYDKKKIQFGNIGSNFFLKKYKNTEEYEKYLEFVYKNYSLMDSSKLCDEIKITNFVKADIIKNILTTRNIHDCNKL
jgi:hypothetical protein